MDFLPGTPPISSSPSQLTNPPEQLQTHLQTTTLPTLQSLLTPSYLTNLRETYLNPYLLNPLSTLLTATTTSTPDLLSILLLVTILLISLKILDYARRIIVFWVMLVVKVFFWAAVLSAGFWVYSVGWERAGREVGRWVGFVEGV